MASENDDFGLGGDGRLVRKSDNDRKGTVENVAAAELRSFIERIERLEEEKRAIAEDIKSVKGEAKGRGYDVPTINKIVAIRRKDKDEYDEEQAVLQTYMIALGMRLLDSIGEDD